MSDIKKFEEMLDRLVNEDKEGAQELFHEIVVEKSRDIYESLLENDLDDDEAVEEATDDEVEESDDEDLDEADDDEVEESDDEELDEDFNLDEFEVEADPMAAMGGDAGDDMMGDVEMPAPDAMDGEEGEEELEDRVMDLEDALDDLKAEFDKMMSDEDGEDGEGDDAMDMDMDMDMDAPADDEAGDDDEEAEEAYAFEADEDEVEEGTKEPKTATEQMREYVEKVAPAKMGDNGVNTKSSVASKNDMGGTASNLVSGGEAKGGDHAGLADINAKEENAGNVNVPGAKGATKMAGTKGHGAEKKGAGETAANTKSITS